MTIYLCSLGSLGCHWGYGKSDRKPPFKVVIQVILLPVFLPRNEPISSVLLGNYATHHVTVTDSQWRLYNIYLKMKYHENVYLRHC